MDSNITSLSKSERGGIQPVEYETIMIMIINLKIYDIMAP